MEAISKLGFYSPKWKLTIEFPYTKEQRFWDPVKLLGLIRIVVENCPWKDKQGHSLNKSLKISKPILHPEVHPDYGPETEITFEHEGILLSLKQLYAYEEWVGSVSDKLWNDITSTLRVIGLSDNVLNEVSMIYSTPLLPKDMQNYRVASKPGDVVQMADGTTAVVVDFNILCGGHAKELTLRPICGIFRHLGLFFKGKLRPTEEEIDKLTKIGEIPFA